MILTTLARGAAIALIALALAGCGETPTAKPAFYTDLARAGASLDANDAAATINLYRKNNGLSQVALDPGLTTLAQAYARDLADAAARGEQIRPDGKLGTRLAAAGHPGAAAKENVSAGYYTFAEAFSGWRDSERHRATMLMADASSMGIAAVYVPGSKYKVYWVLVLAKPA